MILREPLLKDFQFYYELKCEPSSIYWGGFEKAPDREQLWEHFNKFLEHKFTNRDFYILEEHGVPVGYLQLTHNTETEIEIGYGVSESKRGKGYGYCLLSLAKQIVAEMSDDIALIGYVREDNYPSKRCFEKNGFEKQNEYVERYFAIDKKNVKMFLYVWSKMTHGV